MATTAPAPSPAPPAPHLSSTELSRYHPQWKELIEALNPQNNNETHRKSLTELYNISQLSSQHSYHLLALYLLKPLIVFLSRQWPDQWCSEKALAVLANLCFDQWQRAEQQAFLYQQLHALLIRLLFESNNERDAGVRCQAYRALWNLVYKNEKAKREPTFVTARALQTLAKDVNSPIENIRRMCGGLVWALAELSEEFKRNFTLIKGTDALLTGIQISNVPTPSNAETCYVLLSALHIVCTSYAAKQRAIDKQALPRLLRMASPGTAVGKSPLTVGRLSDLIAAMSFMQSTVQQQCLRDGCGLAWLSQNLKLAVDAESRDKMIEGAPMTSWQRALPRLCIALIALCYRSPALLNRSDPQHAGDVVLLEECCSSLMTECERHAVGSLSALTPLLTMAVAAHQQEEVVRFLLQRDAIKYFLAFLQTPRPTPTVVAQGQTPEPTQVERECREFTTWIRTVNIGLYLLVLLTTNSRSMQKLFLERQLIPALKSLMRENALLPLCLRLLTHLANENPHAARFMLTYEDGVIRRLAMRTLMSNGSNPQLSCSAAGLLYALLNEKMTGSPSPMNQLASAIVNNGEVYKSVQQLHHMFNKIKSDLSNHQQQQRQGNGNVQYPVKPPPVNVPAPPSRQQTPPSHGQYQQPAPPPHHAAPPQHHAPPPTAAAPSLDVMSFLDELTAMEQQFG